SRSGRRTRARGAIVSLLSWCRWCDRTRARPCPAPAADGAASWRSPASRQTPAGGPWAWTGCAPVLPLHLPARFCCPRPRPWLGSCCLRLRLWGVGVLGQGRRRPGVIPRGPRRHLRRRGRRRRRRVLLCVAGERLAGHAQVPPPRGVPGSSTTGSGCVVLRSPVASAVGGVGMVVVGAKPATGTAAAGAGGGVVQAASRALTSSAWRWASAAASSVSCRSACASCLRTAGGSPLAAPRSACPRSRARASAATGHLHGLEIDDRARSHGHSVLALALAVVALAGLGELLLQRVAGL